MFRTTAAAAAVLSMAASASAQDRRSQPEDDGPYIAGSLGYAIQGDSANTGAFTDTFITGEGVAVPAGTTLPAGTSLGWDTEFDGGVFVSGAYGWRFAPLRLEAEISYTDNEVETHRGVRAGGDPLGAADAAVLITGAQPLGASVSELVGDGQGRITNLAFAANAFYDLEFPNRPFSLYAGGGLGVSRVKVDYKPTGVAIAEDEDLAFFYQAMAGGEYDINEKTSIYGGYRFRGTPDVDVDVSLVPAGLEVENTQNVIEAGVRYSF